MKSRKITLNAEARDHVFSAGGESVLHVVLEGYEKDKNIIELSRKSLALKRFFVQAVNAGYFLCRHKGSVSSFINLKALRRLHSLSRDKSVERHKDVYFSAQLPKIDVAPSRMLVVFSSVADVMYSPDLMRRNFFKNFGSIDKYVPADTLILRISDVGSGVGSFYFNNQHSSIVESSVQEVVELVINRYRLKKEDIVFYGASKGGTGALYHGLIGGYCVVAVDPIVSDEYYVKKYNDSHFTEGTFPAGKAEKFTKAMSAPIVSSINIIYSERSPQYSYINSIIRENDREGKISFFNSTCPLIKDHPDVGPNTITMLTTLINGIFYGVTRQGRSDLTFI